LTIVSFCLTYTQASLHIPRTSRWSYSGHRLPSIPSSILYVEDEETGKDKRRPSIFPPFTSTPCAANTLSVRTGRRDTTLTHSRRIGKREVISTSHHTLPSLWLCKPFSNMRSPLRSIRSTSTIMFALSLLALLALSPTAVMAADPEVTVTRLENLPNKLFYFDDTPVSGCAGMFTQRCATGTEDRSYSSTTPHR